MKIVLRFFCLTVLMSIVTYRYGHAQMQLVLLKHEQVMLRLNPGDDFVYKLKNSREVQSSYINNLSDTAVTVHVDVVPYHTIDKVYFSKSRFYNRAGAYMVAAGTLLFLIDQLNKTLVQGGSFNLDRGVSRTSLAFIGIGLPMAIIKKKSQRLSYKYKLMMVKKGSPFYRGDPHYFIGQ